MVEIFEILVLEGLKPANQRPETNYSQIKLGLLACRNEGKVTSGEPWSISEEEV